MGSKKAIKSMLKSATDEQKKQFKDATKALIKTTRAQQLDVLKAIGLTPDGGADNAKSTSVAQAATSPHYTEWKALREKSPLEAAAYFQANQSKIGW